MTCIGDMNNVRLALMLAGYRSVEQWAQKHGFLSSSVRRAIYDWGLRTDREPRGTNTQNIMAALRKTMETSERKNFVNISHHSAREAVGREITKGVLE